jgi:K(+)-stimulated pyrophosphate-energized sodium pump
MVGVFIGGMLPFLFSSMAMKAVGRAAGRMIEEVRRQFREIPGLLEGTAKPEYARCVEISTTAAIARWCCPACSPSSAPVARRPLRHRPSAACSSACTVSGVLLAIFMSNAGGAWDNAKKYIEGGAHTAARAARPTRPPSSATPSATPSRTPPAPRSTSSSS